MRCFILQLSEPDELLMHCREYSKAFFFFLLQLDLTRLRLSSFERVKV